MDPEGVDPRGVDPRGVDPGGVGLRGLDPGGVNPRGVDPREVDPSQMWWDRSVYTNQKRLRYIWRRNSRKLSTSLNINLNF